MLTDTDIKTLLTARRPNHALPRAFYIDDAVFDADIRHVFGQQWLFVAASAEFDRAGRFATLRIGDYSIIVIRGADGDIRAFHNTCRHRGSRLCSARSGTAPKLVCPYHQWTYELDGQLLFARDMGPDFDRSDHGLKPVHCRTVAGMVFVCLADEPPDITELIQESGRFIGPHSLERLKVAHQSTIVEEANWKLVLENNRECYHCAGAHPALCRSFDDNPNIAGSGDGMGDPAIQAHLDRCEAAGLPSAFTIDRDDRWRFVRVPLAGKAQSYTMDGRLAVGKLLPDMPIRNAGTLLFFHYPNTWNHFVSDHVLTFRVLPVSAGKTEVTTTWLVHPDAVEGVDYDRERLTEVWLTTNDEDRRVVEENQAGIRSPAYEPGPYSVKQESGVRQFVDWYAAVLAAGLAADLDHGAAASTGATKAENPPMPTEAAS